MKAQGTYEMKRNSTSILTYAPYLRNTFKGKTMGKTIHKIIKALAMWQKIRRVALDKNSSQCHVVLPIWKSQTLPIILVKMLSAWFCCHYECNMQAVHVLWKKHACFPFMTLCYLQCSVRPGSLSVQETEPSPETHQLISNLHQITKCM